MLVAKKAATFDWAWDQEDGSMIQKPSSEDWGSGTASW